MSALREPAVAARRASRRLLVSVRNAAEAREALAGGADILDVKEPLRGSLGRASPAALAEIASLLAGVPGAPTLSAALGELVEFEHADERDASALPEVVRFAKVGLAGAGGQANWARDWLNFRRRMDSHRAAPLGWIAVAYGDSRAAGAPPVEAVASAAAATGCAGLLIDTWSKQSGPLLVHIAAPRLARIVAEVRAMGLLTALAGRLSPSDLDELGDAPFDILAVRTAACVEGDRLAPVCRARVAACRAALQRARDDRAACDGLPAA